MLGNLRFTTAFSLVSYYHEGYGDLGLNEMLDVIPKHYWFVNMKGYAMRYIVTCLACLYNKKPPGKRSGHLNPIAKYDVPMHTLHIDHLGPFVQSMKQNVYLIVAVDGYTKYLFIKAVPNAKTTPVTRFLEGVVETFGPFTSKAFREFCGKQGICRVLNATATPRANGQMERYNRTIWGPRLTMRKHGTKVFPKLSVA